jgi:hypothetical protein
MENKNVSLIVKIVFSIFLYTIICSIFLGVTTKPVEIDSLYYHIPIAESIISGDFLYPDYGTAAHRYFPGATEAILAILIILNIPLNLFNVLGIIVLFASCYFLARQFDNNKEYSLLFASCICTLQVITRWANAQTADIWLGSYFLTSLALLQKPKKSHLYYIFLGTTFGFLIGSKYSGPLFALSLLFVYRRKFIKYLTAPLLLSFGSGVTIFGLFWYARNWVVKGNPFYPLDSFLFSGLAGNEIIKVNVGRTFISYPLNLLNAFLGEYMVWSGVIMITVSFFLYQIIKKRSIISKQISKLMTLSIINFFIFSLLPSGNSG